MKKPLVSFEGVHCANCRASMLGEFCHECGQSIYTVLRPMHHMVEDTLDMVLHVDGRVIHTLPPLFLKPGFLTLEYFSGRRQRYVAPFRLMFVLSLLAFFMCHLVVGGMDIMKTQASAGTGEFARDLTSQAVHAHFEQVQGELLKAKDENETGGKVFSKLVEIQRDQANHRLVQLGAPPIEVKTYDGYDFNVPPIQVSWLPDSLNRSLSRALARGASNLRAMQTGGEQAAEAQERLLTAIFHVLPQTMFVLMPLFALLLKFTYLFKRRLYMEHLIVAVHSHAFLFLTLTLDMLVYMLHGWLAPHAPWLNLPFRLTTWGLSLWVLAYLLIMQKRIYRQGWLMTTLKYFFVGWCYFVLLTIALVVASALALAS